MINRLYISFINFEFYKEISIVIKYPTDSLNYTVQKIFSNPILTCASNFIDDLPQFVIGTNCEISGRILFSSLYSLEKDQQIHIDNFNYQFKKGKWLYHLEYSFDAMQITNKVWNENNMTDIFWEKNKI